MKWYSTVLVSLSCLGSSNGLNIGSSNYLNNRELMASIQEMGNRALDSTADAMSCVANEPCKTNSCLSKAIVFGGPACSSLTQNPSEALGPESSDGHSLGVAALLFGGELDNTEQVCKAVKNSTLATNCFLPIPWKAMLRTMKNAKDAGCKNFNSGIMTILTSSPEDDNENVTGDDNTIPSPSSHNFVEMANMTKPQADLINLAFNKFLEEQLNYTETKISELNDKLSEDFNATWADMLGMGFGLAPRINFEEAVGMKALLDVFATNNVTAEIQELVLIAMVDQSEYFQSKLVAVATKAAINDFKNDILESENSIFVNITEIIAQVAAGTLNTSDVASEYETIGTEICFGNSSDSTNKLAQIVSTLSNANITFSSTECSTSCSDSILGVVNDNVTLQEQAIVDLKLFAGCMEAGQAIIMSDLNELETKIMTESLSIANELETLKNQTTLYSITVLGDIAPVVGLLKDESPAITMFFLGTACELIKNNLGTGLNQELAGSCYMVAIMKANPAFAAIMFTHSEAPTIDFVFSLEDSMSDLKQSCETANVQLTTIPSYIELTTPTVSPTTETVLSGGNALIPSIIALVTTFMFAIMI